MRLLNLIRRKPVRWACIGLMVVGLCIAYPTLNRTIRTFFAERALRERNAELALDWLESIPEWNRVGQTQVLFAKVYRRQGKFDLVRENLQTAWDRGVPVEQLEREQWLAMAKSGQTREAELHLRQLMLDPRDDGQEICESFVTGYLLNHQFAKAASLLDVWEAEFPEDPRPHELRGLWFEDTERWSEAATCYQRALSLAPGRTRIRRDMAACLRELHEYDKAEIQFLQCLQETPDDSQLLIQWGEWLLSNGKTDEAISVLQKVLNLDSGNQDARFAMAKTLLMDGDARQALESLQQLHNEKPSDSKIQYSLASALQASGMTEQAADMFKQVTAAEKKLRRKQELIESLDQDRNQPDVLYEIAMISMNHESPAEGLRWLQSLLDLNPRYVAAHVALADYYHRTGKPELEEKHRKLAEAFAETKTP